MDYLELPRNFFYVVLVLDLIGWVALLLFPRRPAVNFWLAGLIVPLVLSLISIYFLFSFSFVDPPLNFKDLWSLGGIYEMFKNPGLLLVAWTDLMIMDLVAAAWMARAAAQAKIPYVYLFPCLVLSFFFAGFGFTLFAAVAGAGGKWGLLARRSGLPPTVSDPVPAQPFAA